MNIVQRPDGISMSGNMKPFILSSATPVRFVLSIGGSQIIDETYHPDTNQNIYIDVKNVVVDRLSFTLSDLAVYNQSGIVAAFSATFNGANAYSFSVIRAGVDNFSDVAANFLKANFLTWQNQEKMVGYSQPEFLTYYAVVASKLKFKAYFSDNTNATVELSTLTASRAYTADLSYARISGRWANKTLTYYDVWVEDTAGTRLTYVQRYIASAVKRLDEWFLFENSLGGIDTAVMGGDTDFAMQMESEMILTDDFASDDITAQDKTYNKNTGNLTHYERKWILDFFVSKRRYKVANGQLRAISLMSSDVQAILSENLHAFNFTYIFANATSFLNLQRREDLPAGIQISMPDNVSFIEPRLNELPRLALTDDVLFPVQSPYAEKFGTTTWGAIRDAMEKKIASEISKIPVPDIPETLPPSKHTHEIEEVNQLKTELEKRLLKSDVLASTDAETVLTEENVYSALRSLLEDQKRLRKDIEDTAEKKITMKDGIDIGEFIKSMIAGKGAGIDKDGNAQFESAEIRTYFKCLELIYNRLNAIEGDTSFTEFGTIDSITEEADGTFTLTIRKRWDLDFTAFQDHDVVYGVVNNLQSTGEFYTSWLRVHSKNTTANTLSVTMYADEECPAKRNFPPATGMNLTRRGNALNTPAKHNKRQDSWYISTVEGALKFLQGVDSPIIHPDSIALVLGLLPELEKFKDLPINYDQPYLYAKGAVIQDLMLLDYKGKPVKTVRNRGAWVSNPDEPFRRTETMVDEAYHVGCKWQVVLDQTTDEPSYSSQGWLMAEGNTEFIVDIESSKGFMFDYETFGTTLTVIGRLYNQDVTSHILDADVSWTRDTGNIEEDNAWAIKVANAGKSLVLTQDDLGSGYNEVHNCRFTATVTLRDGNNPIQTNKVELIL